MLSMIGDDHHSKKRFRHNIFVNFLNKQTFIISNNNNMNDGSESINLRTFKIITSQKYIHIYPNLSQFQTQIIIQKLTQKIIIENIDKHFNIHEETEIKYASLILGLINIEEEYFLMYAQNVLCELPYINKQHVYQIASINFVPFELSITKKQQQILNSIKQQIFSYGFYFSFEVDLTKRQQKQQTAPDQRFFWNYAMIKQLIHSKRQQKSQISQWLIPVIQGFYSKIITYECNKQLVYYLISRRSKQRSGYCQYMRGVDENGNCANTIQTQQILVYQGYLFSTVFLLGSVPIFWQKKSQDSAIRLTRRHELLKRPFTWHLQRIHSIYGNVMIINLLDTLHPEQSMLNNTFEHIYSDCKYQLSDYTRYCAFNYKKAMKKGQKQSINDIFFELDKVSKIFEFFIQEMNSGKILRKQKGIYRVNGSNNTIRCNRFLMILAINVLKMQLSMFNTGSKQFSLIEDFVEKLSVYKLSIEPLEGLIKLITLKWMNKIDVENLIYSGKRYQYANKNSFLDEIVNQFPYSLLSEKHQRKIKQKALDCLLWHSGMPTSFDKKTKKIKQLSINICTWNVNATSPEKLQQLSKLIFQCLGSDIIVIGIQQMVELNATNNVNNQQQIKMAQIWNRILDKKLSVHDYICIQKLEMVGILMIIFINSKWKNSLRALHKDIVKTGMGGQFGNKGGIIIRMHIYNTSICFICSHLPAGQAKQKQRVDDFIQIHRKAFQQNRQGIQDLYPIQISDYKFFFGDLNFRIEGTYQTIVQTIKKNQSKEKAIAELVENDQLVRLRQENECHYLITSYMQEDIKFYPTYKLEKETGEYTLTKMRVPSYCDRILYWPPDDTIDTFHCSYYNSVDIKGSDHRPVIAKFKLNVYHDEEQKQQYQSFASCDELQESPDEVDIF